MKNFRKLVDQYRDRVYTFALYSLGNDEDAQDVTQEVLIRLWQHLSDLDESTLPAWIIRVTRNACVDSARKRSAYARRVAAGDALSEGVSMEPGPDMIVEASEFRGQIQVALTRIREPYRSVVILREIQDMRYEEIADAVDLPINTVKSYLHRGRRMLREELRDVVKHDPD
jgi:RNA polymerase sigma-70 factor (ECF subfamily)